MQHARECLIGLETEYGIIVDTVDGHAYGGDNSRCMINDVIEEMISAGLRIAGGGVYKDKDTFDSVQDHNAMEEEHAALGRRLSHREYMEMLRQRSGFAQRRGYSGSFLANGARFYNDMAHPEYSCPECHDPYTALCAQLAGDRAVQLAAEAAADHAGWVAQSKARVQIVKNNSDGQGNSYAGHENYLVSRKLFRSLCASSHESDAALLFLITRLIVTGAGKVGSEDGDFVPYQISQRADFFTRRFSSNTTAQRGIINVRDHSYADNSLWGRFHVIIGDSNRSELSIFLKTGITALFLMMLEDGILVRRWRWYATPLDQPVYALRSVSRDTSLARKFHFIGRTSATALEVQTELAELAKDFVVSHAMAPVWHKVVHYWKGALEGLAGDRHAHPISSSLDWVAVEKVLAAYAKKKGLDVWGEECAAIEHSYRMLQEGSIYDRMNDRGQMLKMADEHDIQRLMTEPPEDTKAWFRAEIVRRYGERIVHISWDHVYFDDRNCLLINAPLWGGRASAARLFEGEPSLEEFIRRIGNESPSIVETWHMWSVQ